MNPIPGIQIIGTQRSGSNLLRVILDQSPAIASPHPPHILVTFMPLLPLYGDLNSSYETLVSDVVDYVNANPVPWLGVKLDKQQLFKKSVQKNLIELNKLVYEEAALQNHAKYWCCKSMANVHYSGLLEQYIPELKYIYLYRDGRDVAASFKKAIVGEKHIYHIARQWHEDQQACIQLSESIPTSRFFVLSYESLIDAPELHVRQICAFLDIPYHLNMLQFYTSKESRNTADAGEMWENVKKPIIQNNSGKFKQVLSETDIRIFETVAAASLETLGYEMLTMADAYDLLTPDLIEKYDEENAALKKRAVSDARPDDIDKRKLQLAIINQIKTNHAG